MSGSNRLCRYTAGAALCSLFLLGSCTTDYVTGKKTFSLYGESKEIEMGREADPQIVAQYGLYDDESLSSFVDDLGKRLAKTSQRPQLEYHFRVLDSPVINAFALPGGYVYVTRGILGHFNSEDELAGVLGHEIGHIVARHGVEQMSRQQLAGIGLGLGSVLSEDFRRFAQAAGLGVNLLFLNFSRGQESESDMLGVEYSTKLNYDAHEMAGFFQTLKRMRDKGGQTLPSFLSTHPDPGDREARVDRLANEWQAKVNYQPRGVDRYAYLKRIDGIVYGDDPQQGFVENGVFYHPSLRFQFPVPSGWKLLNSPTTVQMTNEKGDAAIQFTLGRSSSPAAEAENFITKNKVTVQRRQEITVSGYPAVVVESEAKNNEAELGILSYFIKKDGSVYVFHGFTILNLYGTYVGTFNLVVDGFTEVRDQSILSRKPRRLRIEQAPKTGSFSSVVGAMGMDSGIHSELAVVNGRNLDDQIQQGTWLKVVRE